MLVLFSMGLAFLSCNDTTYDPAISNNTRYLHDAVDKTTEVIVHDIFSPVVAARIYAYSNIACYEALQQAHPEYKSLSGQIRDLSPIPAAPADETIDYNIAGLQAYLTVAKALIFSESEIEEFRNNLWTKIGDNGVPEEILRASIAYGQAVGDHILTWSKKDNYAQTRSAAKYTVNNEVGRWIPTPPGFIEGIEPNWREIRPLTLDSATQFKPEGPLPFSTDKNSPFYAEAMEVYTINNENKDEKLAIASFWDCNPYVMHTVGHLMMASKKMTPGGHWMGIVGLASRKAGLDMMGTAEAYTMTSIDLFDGFISCWDEKYRSNLCRPETYINQHIDPNWQPALQTPPFPEHTSGHSVISTASAVVLTRLFGENFAFADSSEVIYGLPVRSFNSFEEAAAEAAVSRHYGGIHYRGGIEKGVVQGRKVGEHIISRISTKEDSAI